MIFSSIQYLLFLPVVVILYWRTKGTVRLSLVVAASFIFYMSWLPIYGVLLFAMIGFNWLLGLCLAWARLRKQVLLKPLFAIGLLANLGCLCYYKYANFFLSNLFAGVNWLHGCVNPAAQAPLLNWTAISVLLPLGISFFVFEFVHYLTDIYRGDKPIRSWLEFSAFAAFFPSQIAGPIKRYQDFVVYLRSPLPWSSDLFNEAGALIMQGLFKKVAIADPIGSVINSSFAPQAVLSSADAWIASVGFVIQVYCDFSGYTDIGRGSALLLGIRLPENFNLPYLSRDLAEFWRRWHMSLSFWLRDYVYIPLGGSHGTQFVNAGNLFITMVACGLWHGADWHYVVFGCMQGLGLIVQREWRNFLRSTAALKRLSDAFVSQWLGTFVTMLFITVSFTIFRAPNVVTGLNVLNCWFNPDITCTLWQPILKCGVLWFLAVYAGFFLLTEALKSARQKGARFDSWLPDQGVRGKVVQLSLPTVPAAAVLPVEGADAANVICFPTPVGVYPAALRFASWTAAVFLMVAARPLAPTPFVYFQF